MAFPNKAALDQDESVVAATDWLGNRFKIGDVVMYCISAGRGQMMAFGRVQKMRFPEFDVGQHWDNATMAYTPLDTSERQVEVQVLTESTSGNWNNEKRTRASWVNPMNITAVIGMEKAILKEAGDA
jgi:hypothetical protein